MANKNVRTDLSEWNAMLDRLAGPARESLARRMAVSGGKIIRDAAKQLAPVSDGPYNPKSRGSQQAGTLRDSMYLAFNDAMSTSVSFTYTVSWNAKQAWWGKLIEFGHWRYKTTRDGKPYVIVFSGGKFYSKLNANATPEWVPAKPFLRPAYDGSIQQAYSAMILRGRQELPRLLRGE